MLDSGSRGPAMPTATITARRTKLRHARVIAQLRPVAPCCADVGRGREHVPRDPVRQGEQREHRQDDNQTPPRRCRYRWAKAARRLDRTHVLRRPRASPPRPVASPKVFSDRASPVAPPIDRGSFADILGVYKRSLAGTVLANGSIIGVDVGGTFTDLVIAEPGKGAIRIAKVPTTLENQAFRSFGRAVQCQGRSDPTSI